MKGKGYMDKTTSLWAHSEQNFLDSMPFSVVVTSISHFTLNGGTYSLLVDDLDNSGQFRVVDQDNTAQFNESPVGSFNVGRHCARL